MDECLHHLKSQLLLERDESHKRLNRIASFQAPLRKSLSGNSNEDEYKNHLHIPETIYSALDNQKFVSNPERNINEMNSVNLDEDDNDNEQEQDDYLAKLNNNGGSQSSPLLVKKKKNKKAKGGGGSSRSLEDIYGNDGKGGGDGSGSSLHKSMSVAELCSDLSQIMWIILYINYN